MSTHFHASSSATSAAATIIPFYEFLYEHVLDNNAKSVAYLKQYWKDHIESGDLPVMDEQGNTLLHLLALNGNANAILGLVEDRLLTNEQLRVRNKTGDTPLHQAARFGMKDAAKALIGEVGDRNHRELCLARNSWGETPAYVAAAYGWEEMFYFLKKSSDYNVMVLGRNDGRTILHAAVMSEYYDFALKIVEEYPELADRRDNEGKTALYIMASKPHTFRSGTQYTFINLGRGTFIPQQFIAILIYCCAPPMKNSWWSKSSSSGNVEDPGSINIEANLSSSPSLFSTLLSKLSSGYVKIFTAFPAIRGLYYTKKKHVYAETLAKKLILKEIKEWSLCSNFEYKNNLSDAPQVEIQSRLQVRNEILEQVEGEVPVEAYEINGKKKMVVEMYDFVEKVEPSRKKRAPSNPLIEAARNGIIELVRLIVENAPHVANAMVDENGRNVVHVAAEGKNIYIYEYLNKSPHIHWDMLRLAVDRFGNTIWHLAANYGKGSKVLFGPGNLMTWDIFWFKFVKRDCDPYLQEHRNSNGLTAKELFVENHKSLREDATKEVKNVNQVLMLISALIGTVNYSALLTIPGGYNQDNGKPIFEHKRGSLVQQDLLRFMIYVAAALLASIFALGSQLTIQMSRFRYQEFFFSQSFKYVLAMTSLFYATNFTVLACVQVFVLQGILKTSKWFTFFGWPCVCAVLVYIDAMYLSFNYLYFLFLFFCTNKDRRKKTYRGISKYLYEKI
ncbi:uncharacterized protein LOC124926997 [Impatiens glandulifera]|uniref:uncharacterized protein LOC124926997 n=1 Tax=Impatiens glandulifera TaxID=253017 RepID=UPI001FB092B8|nr:uncharacterized protein LOC124926997 [Impatiens glandulifera]